ncbi:hypothetical protein LMG24238_05210 [Paraburkholderia sediminicola]|uniref:Uncharacterized protein n=1 Tax=Paraburkholderia sediminicola TaxID=458836 RepID=A0A6J5C2X1_9BURK|nr:hypothetical protein LMG24238_05210 [Paraburkholderia sediminicola]
MRVDTTRGRLQLVVLETHRGAVLLDAHPHRAFFLVAQEYPVGHFGGGAAATFADLVKKRGTDTDARAVGKIVEIRSHRKPWGGEAKFRYVNRCGHRAPASRSPRHRCMHGWQYPPPYSLRFEIHLPALCRTRFALTRAAGWRRRIANRSRHRIGRDAWKMLTKSLRSQIGQTRDQTSLPYPPNVSCHNNAPLSTTMNAADSQASKSGTPRTCQPCIRLASDV